MTLRFVAALMAVILFAAACREQQPIEEQEPMAVSIQEAKARHTDALMDTPGVISVGIGLDEKGEECIIVGLDRDDVTIRQALPEKLDGFEVRVEVVGTIKAH